MHTSPPARTKRVRRTTEPAPLRVAVRGEPACGSEAESGRRAMVDDRAGSAGGSARKIRSRTTDGLRRSCGRLTGETVTLSPAGRVERACRGPVRVTPTPEDTPEAACGAAVAAVAPPPAPELVFGEAGWLAPCPASASAPLGASAVEEVAAGAASTGETAGDPTAGVTAADSSAAGG